MVRTAWALGEVVSKSDQHGRMAEKVITIGHALFMSR